MKRIAGLLLLMLPILSLAQSRSRFARTHDNKIPDNFSISISELRTNIYNGIPAPLVNDLSERACFRFADQSAVQLSLLFSSGNVYSDWPALEDYVNQVLKRVIPQELTQDTFIHAYLVKDGTLNAFMTPSGIMFVHIGLFDGMPTESALAGVLTHELAHYYLRHSLKGFVKQEQNEFERVFNKSSASRFSVANEMQADSLAIQWMNRSGYGYDGMRKAVEMIQRSEDNRLLKMQNVWELPETTHPGSERRWAQIDSFSLRHPEMAGADFLVGKEMFYAFREFAKPEILDCLLRSYNFDLCIEKAFKYHLISPNRKEFIYYLMEGIRRKCYLNADFWQKNFITDHYFKVADLKSGRRKDPVSGNIFKENYKELLAMSEEEQENIQAGFYWEDLERFVTYEEAFDFFAQVGELYKIPECALSNALSQSANPELRKQLLEQYLAYPDVKHRDFATRLLDGTVMNCLPAKTLSVLADVFVIVRQGKEEIFIRNENIQNGNPMKSFFETAASAFEKRRFVDIAGLQNSNLEDYNILQEMQQLTWVMIRAKGEKTELYFVDPRYWEIMHRYQVNEIEFIDFKYSDVRKTEITLDAYQEVLNTGIDALLAEVKRNRYYQIRIGAMRIMPGSDMKIRHVGQEEKVNYNKAASESITEYISENLKIRDNIVSQANEIRKMQDPPVIIIRN